MNSIKEIKKKEESQLNNTQRTFKHKLNKIWTINNDSSTIFHILKRKLTFAFKKGKGNDMQVLG